MAINLLENASTTAPVDNTDWVNAQALVSANQAPQRSILTDWASTSALPSLKQGSFIRYEGNTYQIQSNDEAISGSISTGINYIVMTASGTVLTASLTNDLTGYAYDPAYGGVYNGDLMLLRDIVYYSSSAYNRGWSLSGADFNSWVLASGVITGASVAVGGAITGASASITGAITGASASISGAITGARASIGGAITGASASITGAITGASASISGAITGASVDINLPVTVSAGNWQGEELSIKTWETSYSSESVTIAKNIGGTVAVKLYGYASLSIYAYVKKNGITIIDVQSSSADSSTLLSSIETSVSEGDVFTLYVKSSKYQNYATGTCTIQYGKPVGILNQLYLLSDLSDV